MEKIVINGKWWFGLTNETSFSGVLSITNNDIDLFLIDCDKNPDDIFNMYGFSDSGKNITLYRCFITNQKMSIPGFPTCNITANYYFEGQHLAEDELHFDTAVFTFSFLNYWLDISGISSEPNPSDENGVIIKFKNQESLIFFSNDDVKISFEIV